jgi:multidrug efflux system membrane fusion protein
LLPCARLIVEIQSANTLVTRVVDCIFRALACKALFAFADLAEDHAEAKMPLPSNYPLIFLLAGTALALPSCSHVSAKTDAGAGDGIPVRAVRAAVRDVPLEIAAVGNVEPLESVEVKSHVAGQVERVAFEEGQNVAKGQLLFTIDRSALERQAAELRAGVARDTAMEEQARAVVVRDLATQKQSQSEADVAVQLGKLGVLAGQRVDQLITVHYTSVAVVRSDRAAVDAAVAAKKTDEARLAETELQFSYTNVMAPVSGRAGATLVKAGSMIRDNDTTLVTILEIAPIDVAFGIPEQQLGLVQQVHVPLTVEATYAAGSPQEGRLTFIDNTVDQATGTIRLKAMFENKTEALWPGEFVHVRLRLRTDPSRLVIPNSSVQEGINGKYIWRIESGHAAMTPVTVIRTWSPETGPELAVVGDGVRPGDLVVAEGQLRLTPGAGVSLMNDAGQSGNDTGTAAP